MNFKLRFWLNFLLIFSYQNAVVVRATLFVFLIDDPAIFRDCKNEPNYLGVDSMFDLSDLKLEILDDIVHAEGAFTMVWDVHPDDRVEFKADLFKYERGSWVTTVFTFIEKDVCAGLFDKSSLLYDIWAQYVDADDLKCVTNKGHTFHHQPFDMEVVFDLQGKDMSGVHKIVVKVDAYSQLNIKQPNSICLEIVGEIIRK